MRKGWYKCELKDSNIVFVSCSCRGPMKVLLGSSLMELQPFEGTYWDAIHGMEKVRQKMSFELPGKEEDYAYETLMIKRGFTGWKGFGIALLHSDLEAIRKEFPQAKLYLEAPHREDWVQKRARTTPAGWALLFQEIFPPPRSWWIPWFVFLLALILIGSFLFTLASDHTSKLKQNSLHSMQNLSILNRQDHAREQLISSLNQRLSHQSDEGHCPLSLMMRIAVQTAGLWKVVEWEQKDGQLRLIGHSAQPIKVFRAIEEMELFSNLQINEVASSLRDLESKTLSIEGNYDISP